MARLPVILSEAKDLSFCHVTETCGFCMETGRLSLFDADWKRNVQILRFAQDDDEAKRVILNKAKDLSFCHITETWGFCMETGRLSLFDADWKRNVQILRFAQDDDEAKCVTLSGGKDLSFCHVTETCGFCMATGRLSLFNADWKRNVQILRFAQDDDEAKRVTLSGGKDLSFCHVTETCGFCMETGRLSLFDADWKRNVQILRFAQDDNEAKRVILSGAKDLYETNSDHIPIIPQLSVKSLLFWRADTCEPVPARPHRASSNIYI